MPTTENSRVHLKTADYLSQRRVKNRGKWNAGSEPRLTPRIDRSGLPGAVNPGAAVGPLTRPHVSAAIVATNPVGFGHGVDSPRGPGGRLTRPRRLLALVGVGLGCVARTLDTGHHLADLHYRGGLYSRETAARLSLGAWRWFLSRQALRQWGTKLWQTRPVCLPPPLASRLRGACGRADSLAAPDWLAHCNAPFAAQIAAKFCTTCRFRVILVCISLRRPP